MIRIRLQRRGRKKRPIHHIVVADSLAPRDGRIIEDLGRFNNLTPKNEVKLNQERAIYWIQRGAQPSDTVRSILKNQGILYRVHLMNWGKSEEEIEQALAEWREARETKAGEEPTRKERQRALLEAEEKEYQKQLKKKAEEAAKQKAKEKALASEEEETKAEGADEKAPKTEEAAEQETAETEAEETPQETETKEAEASEPEVEKEAELKPPAEEAEQAEAEEPDTAGEPEVQKEAEAEAAPEGAVEEETEAKTKEEKTESEEETKAGEAEEEKSNGQVSTDMTAKEAIDHIKNTDLDKLKGFVPDAEDRVTVQRAWESKQEEE